VGESERFGEDRFTSSLREAAGAADAVQRIDRAVSRSAQGPQVDDTAVWVAERSPQL